MEQNNNVYLSMSNCEDQLLKCANTIKDASKALQSIGLIDRVSHQLARDHSIFSYAIKKAIENKIPNIEVIKTLKDAIEDGYIGLPTKLIQEIITF